MGVLCNGGNEWVTICYFGHNHNDNYFKIQVWKRVTDPRIPTKITLLIRHFNNTWTFRTCKSKRTMFPNPLAIIAAALRLLLRKKKPRTRVVRTAGNYPLGNIGTKRQSAYYKKGQSCKLSGRSAVDQNNHDETRNNTLDLLHQSIGSNVHLVEFSRFFNTWNIYFSGSGWHVHERLSGKNANELSVC